MARRGKRRGSDKPVGGGGARHPNSLANLRAAPPAPAGHTRSLIHGGRSELLLRDVEREVAELAAAMGDAAPVRDPDGGLPAADVIAVETAARALKRYRRLAAWLDTHGRIKEKTGNVKPAAELEIRAERQLTEALDRLGMNPMARSRLGLNLARTHRTLEEELVAGREAWESIDGTAEEARDAGS
jgi:P27 family predicted phage terminase small subunit